MSQLYKCKTNDIASTLINMCEMVATREVWKYYSKTEKRQVQFFRISNWIMNNLLVN